MGTATLLLGSNLGNRNIYIVRATEQLSTLGQITKTSMLYETEAWGATAQPHYLNQAIQIETPLSPVELLRDILSIEQSMGRQRNKKWEARIIDIDILFYDNQVIDLPELKIPHPYLHLRRFALLPLAEIAADYIHPLLKLPVHELLKQCPDTMKVSIYP